jgi:3-deoxy-D-manno-octulosonic-acid transferase
MLHLSAELYQGRGNLLEGGAEKPVIFSRYMFNFKEISEALITAGGGIMVKDKEDLYVQLDNLLSDKELMHRIGERAFAVIAANSGATRKTIEAVSRFLGEG